MAAMYEAGVRHDRVATVGAWAMLGCRHAMDVRRRRPTCRRPCRDLGTRHTVRRRASPFRGLRPGQDVHYVAADISPLQCSDKARAEALRRGVHDAIEFVEGRCDRPSVRRRPALICASRTTGCTVYRTRARQLAELTRVLRPGGTLRGTSWRDRSRSAPGCPDRDIASRRGVSETPHAQGMSKTWLKEFGFDVVTVEPSGAGRVLRGKN